jgi:Asp-tRNA(Asn)/Glu-tRNA(Gln) amidotransferase A subunit family amidase
MGPLARSAEDVELALGIIAGPDGLDPGLHPVPLGRSRDVDLRGLRVGLTDLGGAGLTAEAWAAVQTAGRHLEALGAAVEPAELDILEESLAVTEVYWARPESLSHREWKPYAASRLGADAIEEGLFRWERLQRRMEAFMGDWDALICPAAAGVAPPMRTLTADDYLYTLPFSLTGQPAAAVPAAWSEGLPLAVQIVGRRWRDDVVLALARGLET